MIPNTTITVGNIHLPLLNVMFEMELPSNTKIILGPESDEDDYKLFNPNETAEKMSYKPTTAFCNLVKGM